MLAVKADCERYVGAAPRPKDVGANKFSTPGGSWALPDAKRQCFATVVGGFDEEPVLFPGCVAKQKFVVADWSAFSDRRLSACCRPSPK